MARSKYRRLPPTDALARLRDGDRNLMVPLGELLPVYNLTFAQLRPFLASGELKSYVLARRGPDVLPGVLAWEWIEFLAGHPELWQPRKPH